MEWWVFALGATVFATASAIARKKALQKEHALEFESARSIATVLLLLFFLPFVKIQVSWGIIGLVWVTSLLGACGILFMAKAYRHSEISHIYPLANLKPFFVVILAYIFLSERISLVNLIGIFVLLISAYALEADHHFSDLLFPLKSIFKSKYYLYMVFALLIFSVTAIFDKYLVSNYFSPLTLLFLIWIFVALNLNIIHGIFYGFEEVEKYFMKKSYVPFLVAFLSLGTNFLYLNALQKGPVSLVTPVLMLSTLFVVLIGGKFFKEKRIIYRVIISIAMLMGAYLVII